MIDKDELENTIKDKLESYGCPDSYLENEIKFWLALLSKEEEAKLLIKLRTCPKCGSIWVCWNWIHAFGGDRKKYEEANPHLSPDKLLDWGHECWDCENCFETKDKVEDGIPYEFLKAYYRGKEEAIRADEREKIIAEILTRRKYNV